MLTFKLCSNQADRANYDEAVQRFAGDAVRNTDNYQLTDQKLDAYYAQFMSGIEADDDREARIRFDSQFKNTWSSEIPSWAK